MYLRCYAAASLHTCCPGSAAPRPVPAASCSYRTPISGLESLPSRLPADRASPLATLPRWRRGGSGVCRVSAKDFSEEGDADHDEDGDEDDDIAELDDEELMQLGLLDDDEASASEDDKDEE